MATNVGTRRSVARSAVILARPRRRPSQVWWLFSQHQPRCGARSAIHSAGTRWSVPREAPVWKHLFFSSASGRGVQEGDALVDREHGAALASAMTGAASEGRTPQNSSPRSTPTTA